MSKPKSPPTRPYLILVKGEPARVIRAANKAHALAYHTATTIRVELATPDDTYAAALAGIKIEDAPMASDDHA